MKRVSSQKNGTAIVLRPTPAPPDWERLASEIKALASDLEALARAVRDGTEPEPYSAATISPHSPTSRTPRLWVEPWFASPPDDHARLASVDLRLAQVRRSLGIVGRVARAARGARPAFELSPALARPEILPAPDGPAGAPAITFRKEATAAPTELARVVLKPRSSPRSKPRARRSARPFSATAASAPAGAESSSSPAIGPPAEPPITTFLKTNRTEGFDIQTLNALPLTTLVQQVRGDRALLAAAAQQASDLMTRVKREVDDPESAGAFLREQVHRWHDESGRDRRWPTRMPDRWAGLFADSRVHGGRLRPWLNHRLWNLQEQAFRAGSLGQKLRRKLIGEGTPEGAVDRTGPEQIRAEVAQAILDDLAAHARDPHTPLPLISLSELAVRRQVVTVNEALGQLFSVPDSGPFVILHPNRYPDCEEVVLRPPVPKTKGAALAYTLGPGRPSAAPIARGRGVERTPPGKASGLGAASVSPTTTSVGPGFASVVPEEQTSDVGFDSETIWQAESVGPPAWRQVVLEARDARSRLAPPPSEFRGRPAYPVLCSLLLDESELRSAFLAVRWRTRPAGPPLLASLLEGGSLAPDVSTDHEYLEAELGELVRVRLATKISDGVWTARGWKILREGSHREGFRFRAERTS